MDIKPHNSRDITPPGRPNPGRPQRPRPLMDDFGPRRPVVSPNPAPHHIPQPQPGVRPPAPLTTPRQSGPVRPQPAFQSRSNISEQPPLPSKLDEPAPSKAPKKKNTTGHAGLLGLAVFVGLAALLLSPLLPGKIFANFPGSSTSSSSGDQSLACVHDLKNTSSATIYNTKVGSPIVYKYSTTTTLHGTCDGKAQTAVGSRTAQFSPLGAVADIAVAAVVAVGIALIWRFIAHKRS
jgi:hypothetical protein